MARGSMMRRREMVAVAGSVALVGCPLCRDALAADSHPPHWGYEAADGPAKWPRLEGDYRACGSGHEQSPIELGGSVHADLTKLDILWSGSRLAVANNGHTIQVNVDPGSRLELDGKGFELKQFHFHHPSEHAVGGRTYPLEAHFVHAAAENDLAVLAVFIEEGAENPTLGRVWAAMPRKEGKRATSETVEPATLLPADRRYWRYEGSLTTPPCSETVTWLVLAEPVTASAEQIETFAAIFPKNARPLQARNRRFLLSSF